jgi:hypothetical protein
MAVKITNYKHIVVLLKKNSQELLRETYLLLGENNICCCKISQAVPARPSRKVGWKQCRRLEIDKGELVGS